MRFRRFVLVAIAAAALLSAPFAHAQDWRGKGRVDGWVKDTDGKPIPDAQIELTRDAGGARYRRRPTRRGTGRSWA